jgi:hypothetical protein
VSEEADAGPVDPFVEQVTRHPEDFGDEAASERIHELLQGYQAEGEILTGWVLLTAWATDEPGITMTNWNVEPGQDWFRTLGILDAGRLKLRSEFLEPEDDE